MGLQIKARRESLSLSQAALASQLKVNQTAVSQWERGVSYPSAILLPEIAQALHCTIDELYQPPEESA